MTRPEKLAESVSREIEATIIELGWPIGTVLGSERDLLERFGVSRGVLREAVRLLEHKQVARMRRGPNGGLVVTEPAERPVIDAVAVYVRYEGVTLDEVFEARKVVEATTTELATRRLREGDLHQLREDFAPDAEVAADDDAAQELHRQLARVTRNPALELLVGVLTRVTALYVGPVPARLATGHQRAAVAHAAHADIVAAVVSGNAGLAAHRMTEHLGSIERRLERWHVSQTVVSELLGGTADEGGSKLGEDLARTIFREIATRGWAVGEVVGSESELIEKHDVGRAVLREAIRLLEHHQIARMRSGPGGGLVVTEPGVDAVVTAITRYLEHRGTQPGHLDELRRAVELAAVTLATGRLDDQGRQRLEAVLAEEQRAEVADAAGPAPDRLHIVLAELSGNRLLALFLRIVVELGARRSLPEASTGRCPGAADADVGCSHERIVQAVLAGGADVARLRMQHHLDGLAS